jgi:hypothetical protein
MIDRFLKESSFSMGTILRGMAARGRRVEEEDAGKAVGAMPNSMNSHEHARFVYAM